MRDQDLDDLKRASLQLWESFASGWERQRDVLWERSRSTSEWLVAALDPKPGQVILELAAGPGDTGFLAARALEPGGRLISSDFSEAMLDVARRRARELGVSNVEFRVIDAQENPLEDDSVDGILCRFALMLMPEPAAALAGARRVLRPGGRLAFAVWGARERNDWATVISSVLIERGIVPDADLTLPGALFSLSDPERVRALVTGADFTDVRIEELDVSSTFGSFEDWWSYQSEFGGPTLVLLDSLDADVRAAVMDDLRRKIESMRRDDRIVVSAMSVNVLAS